MTMHISAELSIGAAIADRFDVQGVLGRGGSAIVYRAHDRVLDRWVGERKFVRHSHLHGKHKVRNQQLRRLQSPGAVIRKVETKLRGRID